MTTTDYDPGLNPHYELLADYETLIRLARRCAYDLHHVVGDLPRDSFFIKEADMGTRAQAWVHLFAKGNPGKDYRHELMRERDDLAKRLDELHAWCAEQGLRPEDKRGPPF